jgi:hypothetical protein
MKIQIVLDFKLVVLRSEHIIWNTLVQFCRCNFRSMLFFVVIKNVLKHIILYVHRVELLI